MSQKRKAEKMKNVAQIIKDFSEMAQENLGHLKKIVETIKLVAKRIKYLEEELKRFKV